MPAYGLPLGCVSFYLLQCREIGYETHEEILRVLHELHTTMKTYQAYQAESRQAETKLRVAEQQRNKLEVANADSRDKLARSKKYKLIEKEVNKVDRRVEYTEMVEYFYTREVLVSK